MEQETTHWAIRLPVDLAERVDLVAREVAETSGIRVSRSAALRMLILRGIEDFTEMKGTRTVKAGDLKAGDVVVDPLGHGTRVTGIEVTLSISVHHGDDWMADPEEDTEIAINPEEWV